MTQMDLLVSNVAELLATAVHEVLRLMGQAVSEHRDESARIRQENQKLQLTLEELQKRLQISDAVQQVSSSVAAEAPPYKSHHKHLMDQRSEHEPVDAEDNEKKDSYNLSFREDNPSALHLRTERREPSNAISSPCDFLHKRRISFSSLRSRSASPDVAVAPGSLNKIKTEAEITECSPSEQTEDTIMDAHLLLSYHNPLHTGHPTPLCSHVPDAGAGLFGVTVRRENSHTCHMCGKSFATASSLGAHFVCHTGERPFACEHCKFRFSRLADLKKHERIHTGEKPYNCALCGRRFNRTENLRRHLRKVHHGALL